MSNSLIENVQLLYKSKKRKEIIKLLLTETGENCSFVVDVIFKIKFGKCRLIDDQQFIELFVISDLFDKLSRYIFDNDQFLNELLKNYFKKNQLSQKCVDKLFDCSENIAVDSIRFNKSFLSDRNYKLFTGHFEKLSSVENINFFKETTFLKELNTKAHEANKKLKWLLSKASICEIFVSFALYAEYKYFLIESELFFSRYRFSLIELLESFLNLKLDLEKNENITWPTARHLDDELKKQFKMLLNGTMPRLYEGFDSYDDIAQTNFLVDLYCWFNWQIDFSGDRPKILPQSLDAFTEWSNVDRKYEIFFDYYSGFNRDDYKIAVSYAAEGLNETSKRALKHIHFGGKFLACELGIVGEIVSNNVNVYIGNALNLLGQASACYQIQYQQKLSEYKRLGYDYVQALLLLQTHHEYRRNPVEIKTSDMLIGLASNIGISDRDFVKEVYNLASEDLSKDDIRIDGKAILRMPTGYVHFMRFFHHDIASILYNSILKQERNANKEYSSFQEKKIEVIFKMAGWSAKSAVEIVYDHHKKSEIDAIAYKDGILFVIQAKITYSRVSTKSIKGHLSALEKAGAQLKSSLNAIRSCFSEVSSLLAIDRPLDEIRIVPLIVSSSFEFDGYVFSGFRKVSLFELQILLQGSAPNLKEFMLRKTEMLAAIDDGLNDRVLSGLCSEQDGELFQKQLDAIVTDEFLDKIAERVRMPQLSTDATATEIADAIESGAIWKFLLDEKEPREPKFAPLTINGTVEALYAC